MPANITLIVQVLVIALVQVRVLVLVLVPVLVLVLVLVRVRVLVLVRVPVLVLVLSQLSHYRNPACNARVALAATALMPTLASAC